MAVWSLNRPLQHTGHLGMCGAPIMNASHRQPERIIRFASWKLLLPFVPLAILVGISYLVNAEAWHNASVWVYLVFGGIVLFLCFGCLVLPRRHLLHLTPEGLTIQYLMSQRRYSWSEVRNVRVIEGPTVNSMPTGRRVVFDLAEDSAQRTNATRLFAGINGYDVSIMAWFDIDAEELAEVLTEWQQDYASGKPATDS
jgi:hypothetical protein